jgi:penicillin-binding protein 1A
MKCRAIVIFITVLVSSCTEPGPLGYPDSKLQLRAQKILDQGLAELEALLPLHTNAVGAIVAIDPTTRKILVMLNDRHAAEMGINRALIQRPPGSAFKPILVAAALRSGQYDQETDVRYCPGETKPPLGYRAWVPINYGSEEPEEITLRQALRHSYSMPSVKIVSCIGLSSLLATARALGIKSEIKPEFSSAFGASRVTLLELTNAYATFASGGFYAEPLLESTVRSNTNIRVLTKDEASRISDMLFDSSYEQAQEVNQLVGIAGKAGNLSRAESGWFIGYETDQEFSSRSPVIGVWIGSDAPEPTGLKSQDYSRAAKRIFERLVVESKRN